MKCLNFARYAVLIAAVGIYALPSDAAWTYTETDTVVNGVSKGSITDGVWTFYAERAKGATDELTVDASKGMSIDPAGPAKIDFSTINGGYKVVKFAGVPKNPTSPLVLYTTEFIAPDCTNLSGEGIFYPGGTQNTTLTKIALREDAVITLGHDRMFMNCASLHSFTPRKIANKSLGSEMFQNCSMLEGAFELPECDTFAKAVFSGCVKIGEIKAPKLAVIGQSTFNGCTSLSNIVVSSSVSKVGNYAFQNCVKITTEFVQGLLNRDLQYLGNSITDRKGCFEGCTGLTGTIVWDLPNLATNAVPDFCFRGCTSLGRVEFRSSVSFFGTEAFSKTKPGIEFVLPENVAPFFEKSSTMHGSLPYPKVYLKGNHAAWLETMKVNNYVIERDDFANTLWSQKLDNSNESGYGTWSELTSRMLMDTSMCSEKNLPQGGKYPFVPNKKVMAFVYYRNRSISGYGCWVIKEPVMGLVTRIR
jgi:hypothetical protein